MFSRNVKTSFENVSGVPHKDYQNRETSVAEYFRKYGQSKLSGESIPTDNRPEVTDNRSVDEMLGDEFEPSLGTDDLDVMMRLNAMRERLETAKLDIKATQEDKTAFDNAVKVLNDENSSYEAIMDAERIINELTQKGKVKRARAKS